ncbi:hypothetical protein D3C84_1252430 [compost metagenome]
MVSIKPLLFTCFPFNGAFSSASVTGLSLMLVANQDTFSCGKATPRIIPGKPVNDSGPPETGILSV